MHLLILCYHNLEHILELMHTTAIMLILQYPACSANIFAFGTLAVPAKPTIPEPHNSFVCSIAFEAHVNSKSVRPIKL